LFTTDDIATIKVQDLICVCHVRPFHLVSHDLQFWLEASPYHFYAKYHFPSLDISSWDDRSPLKPLKVCADCCADKVEEIGKMKEFLASSRKRPLRVLDLCAGAGAFGLALEELGCVKITHAVEISPSAAKTLKYTFPYFF
jgi:DNA (cytosine-5)-methyltransferase 1